MNLNWRGILQTINKVNDFFKDEPEKFQAWMTTKNLNFGGTTPENLILVGREHKVRLWVDEAIDSNQPVETLE